MKYCWSRFSRSSLGCFFMLILVVGCLLLQSCSNPGKGEENALNPRVPSFEPIVGIDFYEVSRVFDTGIAYDTTGFVQIPEWHLRFAKKDSVLVYSPYEDRMLGYKVYHDHDSFYHFARDSWKVIYLNQDSLMLQSLTLRGLTVDKFRSNVYMKFYSEDFLDKKFGHTNLDILRQPSRQDSAFVLERIAIANRNPDNRDSAFASRNYVQLRSKSPAVSIRKKKVQDYTLTERTPAYEYLYPEYFIQIDRAYKDFGHDFSVIVDENGKMRLGKIFVMEEFLEGRAKVIEGVIDVYLNNLLEIEPAHTHGIPHSSEVYLYVKGKKAPELD